MSSPFLLYKPLKYIIGVISLVISTFSGYAQAPLEYEIAVRSSQAVGDTSMLVRAAEPLRVNWSFSTKEFDSSFDPVKGRLKLLVSRDSAVDEADQVLLYTAYEMQRFSYREDTIPQSLLPGTYFLLGTFSASDTAHYKLPGNRVKMPLYVFGFHPYVHEAYVTDMKTSEYNRNTSVHLEADYELSCCAAQLGPFHTQIKVYLSKDSLKDASDAELATFFIEDTLRNGTNRVVYEDELYGDVTFGAYHYLIASFTSSYFSNGYKQVPDTTLSMPLRVIKSADDITRIKRKEYPFLTYGTFSIPDSLLDSFDIITAQKEARQFYRLCAEAVKATGRKTYAEALAFMDSAFAFAGDHRYSSVVYTEPAIVADLYAGLYHLLDSENAFGAGVTREGLNFRLGEAMNMEDLIKEGYQQLTSKILPDSIELAGSMEESGMFGYRNTFEQTALLEVPVFWRAASTSALEHFIRTQDFEAAERLIRNGNEHIRIMQPLIKLLASDPLLHDTYLDLGESLTEFNPLLDFSVAQLKFYSSTGLYQEGQKALDQANLIFECSSKMYPVAFWNGAANFFEAMGEYEAADSLYQKVDAYYVKELQQSNGKVSKAIQRLHLYNQEVLRAKSEGIVEAEAGEQIDKDLSLVQEDPQSILTYIDLLADRTVAQKAGFLKASAYPALYIRNIKSLESQNEYFLANEWKKELTYFLGRDGRYEEALSIYEGLFTIENMKAQAFRLSFSEEAQVYYIQKQLETLSRYFNILEKLRQQTGATKRYQGLLREGLEQVLFYHSFILRGNWRLLYDVYRSDNDRVQQLYDKWQLMRGYLNKLYIRDEPDKAGIALFKDEIQRTEQDLVRTARDSSSIYFDYLPKVTDIAGKLQPGEAAIEMIRYLANDSIYYGREVRYAAFIIKKDTTQFVLFPTSGKEMEGKNLQFYRNAIQFRQRDEISYEVYWKPLVSYLQGVEKVYWAPDGVFQLINPGTLYNKDAKQYLVENMNIEVVPGISDLQPQKPLVISSALLIGDPEYIADSSGKGDENVRTSRSALLHRQIAPLPGTRREVDEVAALLKKEGGEVHLLTGSEATKSEIFSRDTVDLIHFATHGFWMEGATHSAYYNLYETLAHSGLVLAHAQQSTGEQQQYEIQPEGILTASEIQDMNLFRSKLVVLSACETGLGEVVPGEGLYGLKRAFERAGVPHIITTLWKVDDEATMAFMVTFYKNLVASHNLQRSFQVSVLSLKQQYPEPYYWGAFVLTNSR